MARFYHKVCNGGNEQGSVNVACINSLDICRVDRTPERYIQSVRHCGQYREPYDAGRFIKLRSQPVMHQIFCRQVQCGRHSNGRYGRIFNYPLKNDPRLVMLSFGKDCAHLRQRDKAYRLENGPHHRDHAYSERDEARLLYPKQVCRQECRQRQHACHADITRHPRQAISQKLFRRGN